MDIKKRMKEGKLYIPTDENLVKEQRKYNDMLFKYNRTKPSNMKKRDKILNKLLGGFGKNSYIEVPFYANWGCNVYIGDNVYANYNLFLVDDGDIHIGNNVMFGPNVVVATPGHTVEPKLRSKQAQFNIPVTIGNNVWIGASSVILPGITIGDNSVIGAGSIVTKDIPENVVAVGNPCKVLREIGKRDEKYYYKEMEIDI